jgi:hypothetical protein
VSGEQFKVNASGSHIGPQNLIYGIGVKRLVETTRGVVLDRPEEGSLGVLAVAGRLQVFVDAFDHDGMGNDVADATAFAVDVEIGCTAPLVKVANAEIAQLLAGLWSSATDRRIDIGTRAPR